MGTNKKLYFFFTILAILTLIFYSIFYWSLDPTKTTNKLVVSLVYIFAVIFTLIARKFYNKKS